MSGNTLNSIFSFSKTSLVFILLLSFSCSVFIAQAQQQGVISTNESWHAQWIYCSTNSSENSPVTLFRKTVKLESIPDSFFVQISANNSYVLYINDKEVDRGFVRTNADLWNYCRVNIAAFLQKGTNVISVRVANYLYNNASTISLQPSLILQTDSSLFDTNQSWHCFAVTGWHAKTLNLQKNTDPAKSLYLLYLTDSIDGHNFPWDWKSIGFDDKAWKSAQTVSNASYALISCSYPKRLVNERFTNVISSKGSEALKTSPFDGKRAFEIAPHRKVSILFDSKKLTSGYPLVLVSGGSGSKIRVSYAEALIDRRKDKGNRNIFINKRLIGVSDVYFPDGGENRLFEPSYPRAFRFIQLDIETHDNELIINDFYNQQSGYSLPENSFSSDDPDVESVQDICQRTVQLCAQNGWCNDLSYEQSVNLPDTKVQALATFSQTGDIELWRETMLKLQQFVTKEIKTNLTDTLKLSPSPLLSWIDMVYDYWIYCGDSLLVKQYLSQMNEIINQYKNKFDENGLLKAGSVFTDWDRNTGKPISIPSEITMHYAWSLIHLGKIYQYFGLEKQSEACFDEAEALTIKVYNLCYDDKKNLLADAPDKSSFSQQANIMGILSNTFSQPEYQQVAAKLNNTWQLTQSSPFYKIYLYEALRKTTIANGDKLFSDWKTMIAQGLTTTSESLISPKSDCHVRSTAPLYAFSALLFGISPTTPGFTTVSIKPYFINSTKKLKGTQKTPQGIIILDLTTKDETGIEGFITLPEGMSGTLEWNYKHYSLKSGKQKINIKR